MTADSVWDWRQDPALGLGVETPHRTPGPDGSFHRRPADAPGADGWADAVAALRSFLDHFAAAKPDPATLLQLADDLGRWKDRLADSAVPEEEQWFARRWDLPDRGQTQTPLIAIHEAHRTGVHATVTFGRYFLGGRGAAHGGAIMLVFDEVLGLLASASGRQWSRTASLKVDFRAIARIGVELDLRGWFVTEEGRKRYLRGELRDGDTLCAEAEGLFLAILPGQA